MLHRMDFFLSSFFFWKFIEKVIRLSPFLFPEDRWRGWGGAELHVWDPFGRALDRSRPSLHSSTRPEQFHQSWNGSVRTNHHVPFKLCSYRVRQIVMQLSLSFSIIVLITTYPLQRDPNEPQKGDLIWPVSKEKNRYRNTPWEAHDKLHQKYLEISANKIRPRSHYRAHQMAIWLRYFINFLFIN